eukprot:g3232.t1
MRSYSAFILCLLGGVSATTKVCVFDLDNTVLGVSQPRAMVAVEACKEAGYALAVNTAESSEACASNRERVASLGIDCSNDVYLCYEDGADSVTRSKLDNMEKISQFYDTSPACTLLFDDRAETVRFVSENGFASQHVNEDGDGISKNELASAMRTLLNCDTESASIVKYLRGGGVRINNATLGRGSSSSYTLGLQQCQGSDTWTLHGLWPEAENCGGESFDESQVSDILSEMRKFWLSCPEYNNSDEDLWTHEWSKHGSCSGLSQHDYFSTGLALRAKYADECDGQTHSCDLACSGLNGPCKA